MKALFYIHSLNIGGAEMIVSEYMIELKKQGISVVLVVNQKCSSFLEKKVIQNNIPIYALFAPINNKILFKINNICHEKVLGYAHRWNEILAIEKPDIIHIHTWVDTMKNINFPANKMVYTFHADVNRSLKLSSSNNRNILTDLAKKGMCFSVLSQHAKEDVEKIIKTKNVRVIPNSINIKEIQNNKIEKHVLCEKYGVNEECFIVGHVGRLHPIKNHERLLKIFAEIHKKKRNSILVLVGDDVDDRRKKLENIASEYKIDDCVFFLGQRQDARAIIGCFDVFILPSFSECFPMVLLEAQVLGKKCIVTDCVPDEVICSNKCVRMSLEASDKIWAEAALDDSITSEKYRDITELEIHSVTKKLVEYYFDICNSRYIL